MSKSIYEESAELCGLMLASGVAVIKIMNMPFIGYSISGLGVILMASKMLNHINPYKKLFENLKISINEETPKLIEKIATTYGYSLRFNLPVGLSSHDFIKNQLAIEEYLNRKVEIEYKNHNVFIKVFEKELDKNIPYEFIKCKRPLEFAIGKKVNGNFVTIDLEKMIHLLIAAETGGGKSTLLRSIITSIILSNRKIGLHLIDLKNGAEFNVFRKSSAVKSFSRNTDEAENVLNKLTNEVNRRYDLFFENDVVDIKGYNKLKNKKKLDYQIVIVDEYADLQNERESTKAIEILAAKARACGIHLIISTQRPDKEVVNGRIKANIPTVIGLKTMNEINSRIIIDQKGLETLRGRGHAILKHTELTEFQSMQIEIEDVKRLIAHTYRDKSKDDENIKKNYGKIVNFDFLEMLK
ncbi:FtsK/SpoIIIE domain-containing protein [Tissierella praeacuta]|uniref:FtsK/SpoIIIE domain-containing protein n=1 Tax=Tissierella praeacuta TaxID=43131 RepID=UPI003DA2E57B